MDTPANQESVSSTGSNRPGFLSGLAWLLSGFIMPLGSFTYYRTAARRGLEMAILFFAIFTITVSAISSIATGEKLNALDSEIRKSFKNGSIPEITIRDGIAEVSGPQPAVLVDDTNDSGQRVIAVIDTTGVYNEIDRTRYDQGFLLTRTDLHILNTGGRYQTIPLSELNQTFNTNPIVINGETASNAWAVTSIIIVVVFFILLILWNTVVRLMYLGAMALVLWGLISLFRPNPGFAPVLISGLYAMVPTLYIYFLFGRINISFPFLQTLILVPIWVVALIACLSEEGFFTKHRPLRLWRSLVGIPMLILFTVILLFEFKYNEVISWTTGFVTILILAAIGVYFRFRVPDDANTPPILPPAETITPGQPGVIS